jgi:hypothetical protein
MVCNTFKLIDCFIYKQKWNLVLKHLNDFSEQLLKMSGDSVLVQRLKLTELKWVFLN